MIYKNLEDTFTYKTVLLIVLLFITISTMSLYKLINLNNFTDIPVQRLDVGLFNFLHIEYTLDMIDYIKVITIYLCIIFLILKFIINQLSKLSYYFVIRIGSLKKYIINTFICTSLIIFIYFGIGYLVSIVVSSNLENSFIGILGDSTNYTKLYLISLLINYIETMSITCLILLTYIFISNLKVIFIGFISIFSLGVILDIKCLPGYYTILYRSIENISLLSIIARMSLMFVLIAITIYIYLIKKDRIFNMDINS